MGKGKGSFDHWACRVAVNQVIFEIRGVVHEQVIRDAFRLAGNKLPGKIQYAASLISTTHINSTGQYEFVKKGDPPVVGITKLEGVTLEELKRPRKKLPVVEAPPISTAAAATPSSGSPPS